MVGPQHRCVARLGVDVDPVWAGTLASSWSKFVHGGLLRRELWSIVHGEQNMGTKNSRGPRDGEGVRHQS